MAELKEYLRFSVAQRIEHWVQMLAFTVLAFTGIPQKFVGNEWAETWIKMLGGIETVRTLHHIAAIVMAVACLYHVVVVAYKIFVLRVAWTMFPRLDDLLDAIDTIRYNLGLTKERIKLGRYSFIEKAEYWAFVWGALLMGITGFMMWNPIHTARFLPGEIIPAAKAAHGGEALLAVLAIAVWHFYNVHIKSFSKAMFTGKLTREQMEEEHALELERIEQGEAEPRPDPEILKKRERVFLPVAAILSACMLVTLFLFVTYEQTAITTLPRRATVQVFAPLTPTPVLRGTLPVPTVATPKPLPASHIGRTTCNNCHANNIGPKNPADHAGRTDDTCTACHKMPGATSSAPTAAATKPTVAPTAATTKPPAATVVPTTPEATQPASAGPKALPASHAGRTLCNACHETGAAGPKNPPDHAGRTDATCVACHKLP